MNNFFRHVLTLLSICLGIFGFGLVYQGLAHGSSAAVTLGIPILLGGLWWSGQELGRSNLAARRRRLLRGPGLDSRRS